MAKSSKFRGVTLFRPTGKWRAQISAGGKTTSLGDHDTEEEAARAFDRAAINKGGLQAKTNFNVMEYAAELDQLSSLGQAELVQMLRSRARKSGTQTSNYRGVSLLKQTKKWHAQINVSGKQVHLGFFPTEEQAARAYDRAAINKGAREMSKIITNFEITEYDHELSILCSITQQEIVDALANDTRRREVMAMLADGIQERANEIFGRKLQINTDAKTLVQLKATAERAVPKLQHLQRWALPPGSAGSSKACTTPGVESGLPQTCAVPMDESAAPYKTEDVAGTSTLGHQQRHVMYSDMPARQDTQRTPDRKRAREEAAELNRYGLPHMTPLGEIPRRARTERTHAPRTPKSSITDSGTGTAVLQPWAQHSSEGGQHLEELTLPSSPLPSYLTGPNPYSAYHGHTGPACTSPDAHIFPQHCKYPPCDPPLVAGAPRGTSTATVPASSMMRLATGRTQIAMIGSPLKHADMHTTVNSVGLQHSCGNGHANGHGSKPMSHFPPQLVTPEPMSSRSAICSPGRSAGSNRRTKKQPERAII